MHVDTHGEQKETGPTLLELVLRLEGDFRRRLEPIRVTPLQAGMILFLRRQAKARVTDAAAALSVRPATLSEVVKDLYARGGSSGGGRSRMPVSCICRSVGGVMLLLYTSSSEYARWSHIDRGRQRRAWHDPEESPSVDPCQVRVRCFLENITFIPTPSPVKYNHLPTRLLRLSFRPPTINTPPQAPMPFPIRPHRRFPVHGSLTGNIGPLLNLLLAYCLSLTLITLLLSSGPAYADWVEIRDADYGMTVYADPFIIHSRVNRVKKWELYDYNTIQTIAGDSFFYIATRIRLRRRPRSAGCVYTVIGQYGERCGGF